MWSFSLSWPSRWCLELCVVIYTWPSSASLEIPKKFSQLLMPHMTKFLLLLLLLLLRQEEAALVVQFLITISLNPSRAAQIPKLSTSPAAAASRLLHLWRTTKVRVWIIIIIMCSNTCLRPTTTWPMTSCCGWRRGFPWDPEELLPSSTPLVELHSCSSPEDRCHLLVFGSGTSLDTRDCIPSTSMRIPPMSPTTFHCLLLSTVASSAARYVWVQNPVCVGAILLLHILLLFLVGCGLLLLMMMSSWSSGGKMGKDFDVQRREKIARECTARLQQRVVRALIRGMHTARQFPQHLRVHHEFAAQFCAVESGGGWFFCCRPSSEGRQFRRKWVTAFTRAGTRNGTRNHATEFQERKSMVPNQQGACHALGRGHQTLRQIRTLLLQP